MQILTPMSSLNRPRGQLVHSDAPPFVLKVPAAHSEHPCDSEAAPEAVPYFPATQSKQWIPPGPYLPVLHTSQDVAWDVAPTVSPPFPAGQSVHVDLAVVALYLPATQSTQGAVPPPPCLPALHSSQDVAPTAELLCFPLGHSLQASKFRPRPYRQSVHVVQEDAPEATPVPCPGGHLQAAGVTDPRWEDEPVGHWMLSLPRR